MAHISSRKPTGISMNTATVAFGPSRALTSHLRRRYQRCYAGVCRYPRLTFLFDAVLAGIVVSLLVAFLWVVTQPLPTSGVALSLTAPPLASGMTTPVSIHVRSADGRPHYNVRLRMHAPPGAQILRTQPHTNADGLIYLGDIKSGEELSSRVLVQLFQPQGGSADFGFTVVYSDQDATHQFFGAERREVVSTTLIADVPSEFQVDAVVRRGAIVPIRVVNTGSDTLPVVHLQLHASTLHEEERIMLGDLAAGEVRWVYVPLTEWSGDARLEWSVGSASRDFTNGSWHARMVQEEGAAPIVPGNLVSRRNTPTEISLGYVGIGYSLLVVHPALQQSVQSFPLASGSNISVTLPVPLLTSTPNHEWLASTVHTLPDGTRVLGSATRGVIESAGFPFSSVVRYTSSAGDQLGIGPHPPRVGEETRYWVFWRVGPVDSELQDIHVEASLPRGVQTTGNVSAPNGGTYRVSRSSIAWDLARIGGEGNPSEVVFGFEISAVPFADIVSHPMPLVGTSTARAVDTHTSTVFTAEDGLKTSNLQEITTNPQNGVVLPSM